MPETLARAMPAGPAPELRNDLFLRACRGERAERTPIWIMRQAGRYLPEYRKLRARHDFLACCRTPELACELTLQPVARLGVDAAILFSDILVPLPGMGVDVAFDPAPRLARAVRSTADVDALRVPDPREAMGFQLEAIRLLRRELQGRVPLIGFAGAPFTLATYLVEGGPGKSFAAVKRLLFAEPATAHRLLAKCADTVAASLVEQQRAGAQAVMLFDTWAGILADAEDRAFALAYAARVLDAVAAASGPGVPRIYYAGESAGRLGRLRGVRADVIGLDWRVDLADARRALGEDVAVQGNLDPALLLGPPSLIRERAAAVVRAARLAGDAGGAATGHVFNLGHGILPETPPDHARVLVEAVREASAGAA